MNPAEEQVLFYCGGLFLKRKIEMTKANRTLLFCFIITVLASNFIYAQQLAFPGAEGYGRFATGGRSQSNRPAEVVVVTNLDDHATNPPVGSFRWALNQGRATVVDPILGSYVRKSP
jgi:pectate lyase